MGVGEAGQRVRRKPETDEVALIGTRVDRLSADRWVGEADNPAARHPRCGSPTEGCGSIAGVACMAGACERTTF
jgi:hypothetical protein